MLFDPAVFLLFKCFLIYLFIFIKCVLFLKMDGIIKTKECCYDFLYFLFFLWTSLFFILSPLPRSSVFVTLSPQIRSKIALFVYFFEINL